MSESLQTLDQVKATAIDMGVKFGPRLLIAGIILLVAMIGAIVLTLRHKPHIKRQNIPQQVARTPETAVEVVKVKPGQGI